MPGFFCYHRLRAHSAYAMTITLSNEILMSFSHVAAQTPRISSILNPYGWF